MHCINNAGFEMIQTCEIHLTRPQAEKLYEVHIGI
jgi:hypothetical protein